MNGSKKENKIHVSHINVRTSISFLLLKLILLDIFATLIALVYFSIVESATINSLFFSLYIPIFVVLGALKIALSVFIILQWLNDYYEVKGDMIVKREGIIFRKIDHVTYDHIRAIGLHQGVFGKVFNYGTIRLWDYDIRRYEYLFQIHNPQRYYKLIHELIPEADEEKEVIRSHISEEKDE